MVKTTREEARGRRKIGDGDLPCPKRQIEDSGGLGSPPMGRNETVGSLAETTLTHHRPVGNITESSTMESLTMETTWSYN